MRRWTEYLWHAVLLALPLCLPSLAATGQTNPDPKQAVCQASWERCLGTGGGKNWKPIYDRCLKARTSCLGGRAYLPEAPQYSSAILPSEGPASDQANADPATAAAICENGQARGARSACVLAQAGDGYGQSFSLRGPGVPPARIQRASSVVPCAGGKAAMFYPNGRIESCTLDNSGVMSTPLTDTSGNVTRCAPRATVRFDPEGRLVSCDRP